ncbi:MAG: GNAT family N-acetyltransferase [Actinomycetota bacterium]
MTIVSEDLLITPLPVPATLDAPDAADFHTMVAMNNDLCAEETGLDDLSRTAEETLPAWLDQTDRVKLGFVARRGEEVLGAAVFFTSAASDAVSAEIDVMVPRANTGRGAEEALLARCEREARDRGRRTLQTWALHRAGASGRMIRPATGWGEVAATRLTDLLSAHGFTMEQVERNSALDLDRSSELLQRSLDDALRIAGDDYRVVCWTLPTPAHLREGYADVISRMATDVPSGDLEIDEEVWDADRIVRRDAHFTEGGQVLSVAAVEHIPSGRLVAFNELVIGADRTGITHQYGTLVTKEHRGRRLGTIVKCANLLRWREIAPDSPRVSTFNAEENRPMLDINEAIGFVPVSYASAWQKILM